jgi:hypothetical protein
MKIRNVLAASLLTAALAVLPGPAMAAPSYIGPSGYLLTPDATVAPNLQFDLGYHYIDVDSGPNASFVHGNLGLLDHVEVTGTWFNLHGSSRADAGWLSAKGTLLKPSSPFQIAGGVIDGLDDTDRGAYVVGQVNVGSYLPSMRFIPRTLRVGAGWGTGNVIDGIFVNGGFLVGKNIELMAEWIDELDFINTGVRFRSGMVPGLAVDFGVIDVEDPNWSVGLSYSIGLDKYFRK